MKDRFNAQGIDLESSAPEAFTSLIKTELPKCRKIIADSGAKAH